jgi:leucyl aminopeptidase
MKTTLLKRAPKKVAALIPLTSEDFPKWLASQDGATKGWIEVNRFEARAGEVLLLPSGDGEVRRVVFGHDPRNTLWGYAALSGRLPPGAYAIAPVLKKDAADAAALGWLIGGYKFDRYKEKQSGKDKDEPTRSLVRPKNADPTLAEGLADAIHLVRDLINTPANDMGPSALAGEARRVARRFGAKVTVTTGDALLQKNYPLIHAVGRASSDAPRLIDMRWGAKGPKITLVGKGVCFDSGGLDLKPASGMLLMKKDMGGAAHVLGLAQAIMATDLPLRLRVLIPAVENAVAGNAYRPMDVLPSRKGLTVEVGNTDAEGRLVLADALSEASRDEPDLLLDFATLTGAARVALGAELPALFVNDEKLATRFLKAGEGEGDPLWRMPLHAPYRSLLDSKVADISSTSSGGLAGAITAALFLQDFVGPDIPWAHVDLMALNATARPGRPQGGEAMGLRAAYALIRGHCKT